MKDQEFDKKILNMELKHPGLVSKEDEETAWKEIVLEIETNKKSRSSKWWLAVAAIVLTFSIGWWIIPQSKHIHKTGQSEQLDILLTDRSTVNLNHNSTLTVSKDFNQLERKVHLEGEAFFNVRKDLGKPFKIKINDREIQVLGTSFLVKHEGNITTVSVNTGKVQLRSEQEIRILEAKQQWKIRADGKIVQETWDANEFAWYSGALEFENRSMTEVAKTLSKLSKKPVEVSQNIASCKLSLRVDYERIEEVFDIIAETLAINWSEEPKRIYFDGKDC